MTDKLLLVGAGGLGRVTLEHAMEKYQCNFVDDSYPVGMEICGAPVVGAIADLPACGRSTSCWWSPSAIMHCGRSSTPRRTP